ncbi:hypothetical protein L7F22_037925 [Adiantum nelumboides]|nr:hypothetical protein [Adiantum nelumboides]
MLSWALLTSWVLLAFFPHPHVLRLARSAKVLAVELVWDPLCSSLGDGFDSRGNVKVILGEEFDSRGDVKVILLDGFDCRGDVKVILLAWSIFFPIRGV